MNAKLVILIAAFVVLGSTLLVWRHQRNALANELAQLNIRYHQTQQQIWRTQAAAAEMTSPNELQKHIERARLILEPAVPVIGPEDGRRLVHHPTYVESSRVGR